MLDCVLISRDDDFRRQILELARHPDSHARLTLDLQQAAEELPRESLRQILQADPNVVFIDMGESPTTGMRVLEALSQEAPDIALVVAGPQLTAESLLEVIRAGAAEYLPRPLTDEDTMAAFQRVRRRTAPAASDDGGGKGRATAVFSGKGGTGVTVTAANLAITLEELTRKPTLLLDLSLALGTAALALGLQPRYSYLDVIRNFHRIDEELLNSFLEAHESGVAVLASPPNSSDAETPTTDQILGLIRFCKRHFSNVVIDAGSGLTQQVMAALMECDERLLVTTAELPTLRNAKRALEAVERVVSNGKGPARIVLNQYREGMGISVKEVEEALGLGVFQMLERDDEAVIKGLNTGRPAVLTGRSRFAKGIGRLGSEIAGPDRVSASGNGVFGSLLRPFRSNKTSSRG